jgi:hypothetical protein
VEIRGEFMARMGGEVEAEVALQLANERILAIFFRAKQKN